MDQLSRMDVFQSFQQLVNNILFMDLFQNVGSDDSMQISVHEIEY